MQAKEPAPANVVSGHSFRVQDLVCGKSAMMLWYLPTAALFVDLSWAEARVWLWTPAFLVMGVACLVNAARCGRLHCFVTGPIYLLSAVYVALAAFGLLPIRPGTFLLGVLCITILAFLAEVPLGRYRKRT